ncbi:MAG TPA: pectinesterase family protein, partial [Longimicrobiales bacterium]|nr:pectinesterase family protein [Longimicrobiales bacterium]
VKLLEKLPKTRAKLLYPLPHPSASCNAECLALSQVIAAGRRAGWASQGRWYDVKVTTNALDSLIAIRNPSPRIQAAAHGAAAWLQDAALYHEGRGPLWTARYVIGTNEPVDTANLSAEPQKVLTRYGAWRNRLQEKAPRNVADAVVDPAYRGAPGAVVNGRRTYNTIGRALDAAPANAVYTIHIRNGRYNERVVVEKPHIQFIGESRDSTILSYDVAAGYASPTGGTFGTRGSWVLRVAAPDFKLTNMTVENTFDYMKNYTRAATDSTKLRDSQGVAVMLDNGSDRAMFESCAIRGHQDTLLPNAGRSYFHGCIITGSVDFIFGAGRAVFDSVDVVSRDRGSKSNNGYITAASTPLSQAYGFVFLKSRLLKESPAMAANTVSLGRPWHPSSDPNAVANVAFINTWMDDHISTTKRWESMNSTNAAGVRTTHTPEQSRFFEYKSLDAKTSAKYSIITILNGWNPRGH